MMHTDFENVFFSDSHYEELTAEITYKDQMLCQLNQDQGIDSIEVEFFSDSRVLAEKVAMKFPVDEFLSVLKKAKKALVD